MAGKKEKEYAKKKETYNIRIIITILLMMVLLLGDLYVVLTDPSNFVALIVITVVALADAYVLIVSVIQQNYKREMERQEQFDSLFKSEKASYLLLRKNFEDLEERLDRIEDGLGMPVDEIISAQKSLAKVTISRNKENSDAVMNSNDKIFEKVFSLEDSIAQSNEDLLKRQEMVLENNNKDLILKQQEVLSRMNELELNLKNEILDSVNKLSNLTPKVVVQAPVSSAPSYEEKPIVSEPEPMLEESMDDELEPVAEEPAPVPMPELSSDPNHIMTPDEIAALLAATAGEAEPEPIVEEPVVAEPEPVEEPTPAPMPELSSDPNHIMTPDEIAALLAATAGEVEPDPIVEEPVVPEPEPVEEPAPVPMPELSSDPNHIMTPDEIAALLAATAGEAEPEPIVEEPVVPEPEPIVEEPTPAPMPEMTGDPNRMMTPEEIAALFANV